MTLKILLIGTLPPPVGGTTVSLSHLVRALEARKDVSIRVVTTSGIRSAGFPAIMQFLRVLNKIFHEIRDADVVTLHVGLNALPVIGPFVLLLCHRYRKPLLIRRFGGKDHRELLGLAFRIGDWVIRQADLYLVQTRALANAAKEAGLERVEWFPTTRPLAGPPLFGAGEDRKRKCRQFVFLSHVRPTKGIPEVVSAAERLDEDICVNIFGPFYDGLNEDYFRNCQRVRYCGVVDPKRVPEILRKHDALVLPTYYEGEGYPGAILEAFNAGIPVITTTWKSIPEIVDDTCGILVQPHDADDLYRAMSEMAGNTLLYERLCRGVLERRVMFDFDQWIERFISFCRNLIQTDNLL